MRKEELTCLLDIRRIDTKAAAQRGLTFDLLWEDQPVGVKISVVGAGSEQYKKHKAIVEGKEANAEKRGKGVVIFGYSVYGLKKCFKCLPYVL